MLVEAPKKERNKRMDSKHGSEGNSDIFCWLVMKIKRKHLIYLRERKPGALKTHVKKEHGKMGNIN